MKIRLLPLLVLAVGCSPAADPRPGPGTDGAAATTQVREATLALQAALNTHDPEAILAHYRLDDAFVYVGCTNYMFGGGFFGAIVSGYHRENPGVTYDLAIQGLQLLGDRHALVSLQGRGGGSEDLFVTRALARGDDGRWLVFYEHESWPGCPSPTASHPGTAPGGTP